MELEAKTNDKNNIAKDGEITNKEGITITNNEGGTINNNKDGIYN